MLQALGLLIMLCCFCACYPEMPTLVVVEQNCEKQVVEDNVSMDDPFNLDVTIKASTFLP